MDISEVAPHPVLLTAPPRSLAGSIDHRLDRIYGIDEMAHLSKRERVDPGAATDLQHARLRRQTDPPHHVEDDPHTFLKDKLVEALALVNLRPLRNELLETGVHQLLFGLSLGANLGLHTCLTVLDPDGQGPPLTGSVLPSPTSHRLNNGGGELLSFVPYDGDGVVADCLMSSRDPEAQSLSSTAHAEAKHRDELIYRRP